MGEEIQSGRWVSNRGQERNKEPKPELGSHDTCNTLFSNKKYIGKKKKEGIIEYDCHYFSRFVLNLP